MRVCVYVPGVCVVRVGCVVCADMRAECRGESGGVAFVCGRECVKMGEGGREGKGRENDEAQREWAGSGEQSTSLTAETPEGVRPARPMEAGPLFPRPCCRRGGLSSSNPETWWSVSSFIAAPAPPEGEARHAGGTEPRPA